MYSFRKIFKPEIFQGENKKNNYFEGWYFKFVDNTSQKAFAIIPGISMGDTADDASCFIQVIDGIKGHTYFFEFDFSAFEFSTTEFFIKIGENTFSAQSITLNLANDTFSIKGELEFENVVKIPKNIFSPGIMGYYSYFTFMECNHGLVSINHTTKGSLIVNKEAVRFDDGRGYIEKDWGKSFPSSWIWLQGNNFDNSNTSFMLSVANVPFAGNKFIGFLCFFYVDDKFIRFATYNFSKIKSISLKNGILEVHIKKGKLLLVIKASQALGGLLKAPKNGNMDMSIEESINAKVDIELYKRGKSIYKKSSTNCGMETSENCNQLVLQLQ